MFKLNQKQSLLNYHFFKDGRKFAYGITNLYSLSTLTGNRGSVPRPTDHQPLATPHRIGRMIVFGKKIFLSYVLLHCLHVGIYHVILKAYIG